MTKLASDTPGGGGGTVGDGAAVPYIPGPSPLVSKDAANRPEVVNKYGVKLTPISSCILASYGGFVKATPGMLQYYAKSPSWNLNQSLALLSGADPNLFTWEILSPHVHTDYYIALLDQLRSEIKYKQACRQLYDQLRPLDVLERAKELGCDVPEDLEQAVRNAHQPAKKDLEAKVQELADELERSRRKHKEEIKKANARTNALKRMIHNILHILFLLLEKHYGLNFMTQKSKGKKIVSDLKIQFSDRQVSAETIDRYLRVAKGSIDLEDFDDVPMND